MEGFVASCRPLENNKLFVIANAEVIGGQGRNRTADAGLFRAAYRFAEVV